MAIFVIDSMRQCFLIKSCQILWEKVLKMKVKVIDISCSKSNHFFFNFHKLSAVSLLCKYQVERVTFVSFSTTKGSTSPHNTENKGRRIGLRIFGNYFLKNLVFLKNKGFLREEYINSFYDKFCH